MNQYNIINVNVSFDKLMAKIVGCEILPKLVSGDYNSTKMSFNFDREYGTKILEIKNKRTNEIVYVGEIHNNEVILCGEESGTYYSIFNEAGDYICEISLYGDNSKLTCLSFTLPVAQEQIIVSDETAEPYLPIFDDLIQQINDSITEVANVNIDAEKVGTTATVSITNRNGETKSVNIYDGQNGTDGNDGVGLEYNWDGTLLGIKREDEQNYEYVNLKGDTGNTGSAGADGFSPTASVSKSGSTATITITDKNGTTTAQVSDGTNGQDGADGYSPSASVSQSGDVTTISITDKVGTTTASIDLSGKQNTLTAGTNITIENNTISASGGANVYTIQENATNAATKTILNNWFSDWDKTLHCPELYVSATEAGQTTVKYKLDSTNKTNLANNFTGSLALYFVHIIGPNTSETGSILGTWLSLTISSGTITSCSWLNTGRSVIVDKDTAQSISGTKTFTTLPESSVAPTSNNQFANKKYVDDSISNAIGSINTILATLTTPSNGGNE